MHTELEAIRSSTERSNITIAWIKKLEREIANKSDYLGLQWLIRELVYLYCADNQFDVAVEFAKQTTLGESFKAELLLTIADKRKEDLKDTDSANIAASVGHLLIQVSEIWKQIIEQSGSDFVSNWIVTSALRHHAQVSAEAAVLYDAAGQIKIGNSLREQSIHSAERLISNSTGNNNAVEFAVQLLLPQKYNLCNSLEEYIQYVEELVEHLSGGSRIIWFLNQEASNLSKVHSSTTEQMLLAANRILDIVLELNERWYKDSFTYRFDRYGPKPLMLGASNAIRLKDLDGAAWRIDRLVDIELKSPRDKNELFNLQAMYSDLLETQEASVDLDSVDNRLLVSSSMPAPPSSLPIWRDVPMRPRQLSTLTPVVVGLTLGWFLLLESALFLIICFAASLFARTDLGRQVFHRLLSPIIIVGIILALVVITVLSVSFVDWQSHSIWFHYAKGNYGFLHSIYLPFLIGIVLGLTGYVWLRLNYLKPTTQSCSKCRYDLRGMTSNSTICPECGKRVILGAPTPPPRLIYIVSLLPGLIMFLLGCACIAYAVA